jgi:chemotaxis protein CheY-P-specific phosphatase CheC/ActR/RegA family two-component response regulator
VAALSGARILICDDSSFARKQIARALPTGPAVEAVFATDGEEGLAAIRAGGIDLVFLDLNMPNLDGYGVLRAVQEERLDCPIVVVSGDIQPEAHERVMRFGAEAFIRKPVAADQIVAILERCGLASAGAGATTPAPTPAPIDVDPIDGLREVSNVAMGRAADLLARLLEVFVEMPVPTVNHLESGELQMALLHAAGNDEVSALCQGFIGGGISGEALLLLHESSYTDLAALLRHTEALDDPGRIELLMDTASLLIGAFMNGLADQLDVGFSISHPVLLGHHADIAATVAQSASDKEKILAIELGFKIEHHNISAQLLLLFTEASMPSLHSRIAYQV